MNILQEGIIIEVGERPGLFKKAIGVIFIVESDLTSNKEGVFFCMDARVIEDPNGWGMLTISHSFNPDYDKILNAKNSLFKDSLYKY